MNKITLFMNVFHTGKRSGDMLSVLIMILAVCCITSANSYKDWSIPGQVFVLVMYLTLLVGITQLKMPVFKSNFFQTIYISIVSGVLDSFVLLAQVKKLKTTCHSEDEEIGRMRLFSIYTIGAIIGGLWLWFGEVYAAGLYAGDKRTGALSALFVLPPVLLFSVVLGIIANSHKTQLVKPSTSNKFDWRNTVEFLAGITILLFTHNALLCVGIILLWAWLTNQTSHLFDEVIKNEIEWGVIIVLVIAMLKGEWLVENVFLPLGLATGEFAPIIPSAIQAVLWGPLYNDPSVHFWVRLTNLSVGAGLLPISSLVGVMIFKKMSHWRIYLQYSIPLMFLWFCIMRGWIWLVLNSPAGRFLEHYAQVK